MLIITLLVLGLGGIVAQTLLLREMLILFSGNELSLCVVISSWVVAEALGAFIAGIWSQKRVVDVKLYTWATLLFSAAFPLSIYATRLFKVITGIPPEIALGLASVLWGSFVLLLPTAFLHGFLFSLACALYAAANPTTPSPAGRVYFYETVGTILGGFVVSYVCIPHVHAFHTAFGICLLNGICSLFLLSRARIRKSTLTYALTGGLLVALPAFVLLTRSDSLHELTVKKSFAGRDLVYYENSFYQNIAVAKTQGQYTFFSNGLPLVTTPVPDLVSVEEFVHFSLAAHPSPERILFLGGGAGGAVHEALKYPSVRRIDYVELDPAMLQAIRSFSTPLTEEELTDTRVHLHYADGRRFIRETDSTYDVILLATASPSNLRENRFFTEEFFALVRNRLDQSGILAFRLPGSLAYYNSELKSLNTSALHSLRSPFPYQYVIPGDTNIVLASRSAQVSDITASLLYTRLMSSHVSTNLITKTHLEDRLQQRRRDWFHAALGNAQALANHDFLPAGVFYALAYENVMLTPFLKPLFDWGQKVTFHLAAAVILLLFGAALLIGRRWPGVSLPLVIGSTGLAGMTLELLLIFGFQVVYGYVFYEIALLLTAFMAGIAAGSVLAAASLRRVQEEFILLLTEAGLALYVVLVIAIFHLLSFSLTARPIALHLLFLVLLFASGIFIGLEFPLASSIYRSARPLQRRVGALYAADLVGGCAGGLFVGLLFFPLLGLFSTLFLMVLLKACTFIFLFLHRKRAILI